LKQTVPTGNSLYDAIAIDHGTAQYLLSIVEPIQLGYGAVIISFLGAIHWVRLVVTFNTMYYVLTRTFRASSTLRRSLTPSAPGSATAWA
jgi:hypothetical protein